MKTLKHLFERNLAWASEAKKKAPEFFSRLAAQQTPEYLWIGCSDSRVPANQIVDLDPGEMFVHRNIANLVVPGDLNCLSVIQFAVDVLGIGHIIVCGHYGCGGILAALEDGKHGLVDDWLGHVKTVIRANGKKLEDVEYAKRLDLLCELNVVEQVVNVCNSTPVRNAWLSGRQLTVHGWIYDVASGLLRDLDACISSVGDLEEKRSALAEKIVRGALVAA